EPVLGESLAMIGYSWIAEVSRAQILVGQFSQTVPYWYHAVGIIGMKPVGGSSGVGPLCRFAAEYCRFLPMERSSQYSERDTAGSRGLRFLQHHFECPGVDNYRANTARRDCGFDGQDS